MKKTVLAFVSLLLASCAGHCIIEGEIEGVCDGMIVAYDMFSQGEAVDSTKIADGKFVMKFRDARPRLIDLRIGQDQEPVGMFFTENYRLHMSGNPNLANIMVRGSKANEALSEFNAAYFDCCRRYGQVSDEQTRLEVYAEFHQLMDESYKKNRDNVFGLHLLVQMGELDMTPQEVLDAISELPEPLRQYDFVKRAIAECETRLSVSVGGQYVDFEHENPQGEVVSLSQVVLSGKYKYVLLDFWASWCAPCRNEMPYLKSAYKKYHELGFEIFSVSWDTSREAWTKAIEKYGMEWTNVSPLEGGKTAFDAYAVTGVPSSFLIECSTGKIVEVDLRGEKIEEVLSKMFK